MGFKRYLTLDNLYDFYLKQGKSCKFSANEENGVIVVQVPGNLSFSNEHVQDGLLPVDFEACHTGKNRNQSKITKKTMNKALPSVKNRPILAYIHEVNGQKEFGWHAIHEDDDGNDIYDEKIIGIIPESCKYSLVYDKEKDRYYANFNGYLYEDYTEAPDILRRMEGKSDVSVELDVLELSFDANEKVLSIDDFIFRGITLLGVDDEGNKVEPGMEGANIKISDFSIENNSIVDKNKNELVAELQKLNGLLSTLDINKFSEKGGKDQMNKFEELLQKYNKTAQDINFEYENLSDEELEAAFAEAFETGNEPAEGEGDTEPTGDFSQEPEGTGDEGTFSDNNPVESHDITFTVNGQNFSVSLNDTIYALTTLVNDTYSEADNAYYSVIAYDDNVVMVDYWSGAAYRQSYKVRKGVYSLQGDRVSVHPVYLTDDEESQLDNMKSNYSAIESELNTYHEAENDAAKMQILESVDFECLADNEKFKELVSNHADFSVKEVEDKCNQILLEQVKADNKANFAKTNDKKDKKPNVPAFFYLPKDSKKKSRYGNIFNKK